MTPTQRAAALRLADVLDLCPMGAVDHEVSALLRELAAEPVQEAEGWKMVARERGWLEPSSKAELALEPQAEPVKDLRMAKWLDPKCADAGACQSLVFKSAHPPPQRQPLRDEEIDELVLQVQFLLICDGLEELKEIARAVERAHGIGETT